MGQFTDANKRALAVLSQVIKGNRMERLMASLAVVDQSLEQGSWITRGRIKAESGFYQGMGKHRFESNYGSRSKNKIDEAAWDIGHVVSFGGKRLHGTEIDLAAINLFFKQQKGDFKPRFDVVHVIAWLQLVDAKNEAFAELDASRPVAVMSKIGLSPKVTKTLKEMDLDIDLPSIKPAEIAWRLVPAFDKDMKPIMHTRGPKKGEQKMERSYYIKWEKNTVFGMGRFGHRDCEACGKTIPSGMFSPIQATDTKSGKRLGMYLGLDCAHNIFGIKDVGIKKEAK